MESYGDSLEITFDNSKTTTHTYISSFAYVYLVYQGSFEKKEDSILSLQWKNALLHNWFFDLKH